MHQRNQEFRIIHQLIYIYIYENSIISNIYHRNDHFILDLGFKLLPSQKRLISHIGFARFYITSIHLSLNIIPKCVDTTRAFSCISHMMFKQVVDPFYSLSVTELRNYLRTPLHWHLHTSHFSFLESFLTSYFNQHRGILQVYLPGSFKGNIRRSSFFSSEPSNTCKATGDFRKFFYFSFFLKVTEPRKAEHLFQSLNQHRFIRTRHIYLSFFSWQNI